MGRALSGRMPVRNDEKNQAVLEFLENNAAASQMSSRAIAAHIGCSHTLVCDVRNDLEGRERYKQRRLKERRMAVLRRLVAELDESERKVVASWCEVTPGP